MSTAIARTVSIALLALLAFSVVSVAFSQQQQANALSALSITSKPTLTSITSGKWQRVWTNTAGTGTYFVDSGSGNFKAYLVNNTGSIVSSVSSALVGTPVTVTALTGSTTRTDNIMKQDLGGNTQSLLTGSTTFATEYAATASSLLVGQTINSVTLYLKKTGAPAGTATVAVFDSSGNTVTALGTQNVASLTTSYVATTFTTTTTARTIANGDRIGIFYNGGSAGNTLDVEYNNNGGTVYDGNANSIVSLATGAQGAAAFSSQTARDLRMILSYVYGAGNANLASFSATELYENQGQIIRAIQSDDDSTDSLRSGSTTIIAEKAAASSTLIGTSTYDTARLYLKKSGSPTGTATIGVFDSSGNLLSTFGTQNVASLTTSFALYTYQSSSAISIASGQYVGIQYSGGSVGNTLDIEYTATNPYDGTNSVISRFAGSWTDTSGNDFNFKLSQEVTGAASQESGANIYADFGSNQPVGGMYVYFPDAAKIPQTIKLSTSTDNISYTDRFTYSPTQSTGGQYLPLDASYSVRYVKLTVVTWGTAKSMQLGEYVRLPGGGDASAISAIEDSGSVRSVFYYTVAAAGGATAYIGQINIDTGVVISATTQTVTTLQSTVNAITVTKNKVYLDYIQNGGGALYHSSINRDMTGFANNPQSGAALSLACAVKTDGAAAAQDVYYCIAPQSGAGTTVYSLNTSQATTSLGTVTGNSATDPELTNLSDKMVGRATAGGTENTFTITKATDVVSSPLFTKDWTSYALQQFDFTGSVARTFKTNTEAYYATTTASMHYTPAGVLTDPAELYAETVTPGTGTITNLANTIYRISNTLAVTGSATTWTPKAMTASATFTPTAYTEHLTTSLVLNTTAIEAANVIRLVCDANYQYPVAGTLYTGSDSDCTLWRILATSADTVGRQNYIPYSRTPDLVHTPTMSVYTFVLNAGDPTAYYIKSLYNSKVVDVATFDSGFTSTQYYLFGQCYSVDVVNANTGDSALIGNICANAATTKNINVQSITVPPNWQGSEWSWNAQRNYSNATNNSIIFTLLKQTTPFSANIHIVNNLYQNGTVNQWYNFTNQTSTITLLSSGYLSNNTLWISAYEGSNIVVRTVLSGKGFALTDFTAPFGPIFGISIMGFFIVVIAGIFPKSMGTIAIIATLAVTGILWYIGWLDGLPLEIWPALIGLAAIGIFSSRRG